MLISLYIENIAIIRKLSVDVEKGFTVLTGETGAGKSLLIDSIHLLLGAKSSRDKIGPFAEYAFVKAGFCNLSDAVITALEEASVFPEDGVIYVERRITKQGRSTAKINGVQVQISFLQSIAPFLINIHGQHDNVLLLDPATHIVFLDRFAGKDALLKEYGREYAVLRQKRTELAAAQRASNEKAERLERIAFKLSEYEELSPYEGMLDQLKEKQKILRSREDIRELLQIIRPDEEHGIDAMMARAVFHAEKLADVDPRIREIYEKLEDMRQLYDTVVVCGEDILSEFSEGETLSDVEDKLYLLERMLREHGPTERELLQDLEDTKKERDRLQGLDEEVQTLQKEYLSQLSHVQNLASRLSVIRRQAAKELEKKMVEELAFLDMPAVSVCIKVEDHRNEKGGYVYTNRGFDTVEFLLSANAGQSPRPLDKIASGGELSRIMLSLTAVLCGQQDVGTLIFDEIDTGVSGKTAEKIGIKLKEVSGTKQVLSITHLAQIASLGDHHLKISKTSENSVTETTVAALEGDARVAEIARIIGGLQITESILKTAREMLS